MISYIAESYKKTVSLHHAYLCEGDPGVLSKLEEKILQLLHIEMEGNPDVLSLNFSNFGIDEAHLLTKLQSKRAQREKKLFFVSTDSISREAENALLKTLEEPTLDTHFFFVIRSISQISPTLRSRFVILGFDENVNVDSTGSFLMKNYTERLSFIAPLIVHPETTEERTERSMQIDLFLKSVEREVSFLPHRMRENGIKEILFVRKYLHDTAPSHRQLLENLALSLPVAK